ncbi:hypothetical protein TIFTF001_010872 [Ficus carica]|uniref:Uncharacterized protein n=1 Tax=Ficus carica TaxID=3494 RepID=A0AA87ZYV1_FICCA|nr:hypothetical protein TIFTF001_010872 [Ficus carica]
MIVVRRAGKKSEVVKGTSGGGVNTGNGDPCLPCGPLGFDDTVASVAEHLTVVQSWITTAYASVRDGGLDHRDHMASTPTADFYFILLFSGREVILAVVVGC